MPHDDEGKTGSESISYWFPIENARSGPASYGFLSLVFDYVLSALMLCSVHHIVQSALGNAKRAYLATDIYCLGWFLFVLLTALCEYGVLGLRVPDIVSVGTTIVLTYRLAEILCRELWVVLFRNKPLSGAARVLLLGILNYATATGIFGYLQGDGPAGFSRAIEVSITFSLSSGGAMSATEACQRIYCFIFMLVVISTFVNRLEPDTSNR
jgi:hypothetical protein